MNREELKVYKNAFFAIDFFHNGCIEEPELKKAFKLKNIEITDEEINHLFKIMDQNFKGAIDYTEFLMAGVNREQLLSEGNLTKAFNYFSGQNCSWRTRNVGERLHSMDKKQGRSREDHPDFCRWMYL